MSTDTPSTDTADISSAASLATLVHRRQNLQILATFAALVALVLLLNLTPVPGWVCSFIELEPDVPADLLGEAYWDDCFGGPLGDFAAGSLPRPEHLSYAPEADQFLAEAGESSPPKKRPSKPQKPSKRRRNRAKRSLEEIRPRYAPFMPSRSICDRANSSISRSFESGAPRASSVSRSTSDATRACLPSEVQRAESN